MGRLQACALLVLLVCVFMSSGAQAQTDPCAAYSGSCGSCATAPMNLSCGWCQSPQACRSGNAYGQNSSYSSSPCNNYYWVPPATPAEPNLCRGSTNGVTIANIDPCASYSSCSSCAQAYYGYKCSWCAGGGFYGTGICMGANTTDPQGFPRYQTGVVNPSCPIPANGGLVNGLYAYTNSTCLAPGVDPCNIWTSCSSCSSPPAAYNCGWCSTAGSTYTGTCQTPDTLGFQNVNKTCPYGNWRTKSSGCYSSPYDSCSSYSSCATCAQAPASYQCGWCQRTRHCNRMDSFNNSATELCTVAADTGNKAWYPAVTTVQCPADYCANFSGNCTACRTAPASLQCGYCDSTGICALNSLSSPLYYPDSTYTSKYGTCRAWMDRSNPLGCTAPYQDLCGSYTTCTLCTAQQGCGYSTTNAYQKCVSANYSNPATGPQYTTSPQNNSWTPYVSGGAKACNYPDDPCMAYRGSCGMCGTAPANLNCGYCNSTSDCRTGYSYGQTYGSCDPPANAVVWKFKPDASACFALVDTCVKYTSCATCEQDASGTCGWCPVSEVSAGYYLPQCRGANATNNVLPGYGSCLSGSASVWLPAPVSNGGASTCPADPCNAYSASCTACGAASSSLYCGFCFSETNNKTACKSGGSSGPTDGSCTNPGTNWNLWPSQSTCLAKRDDCNKYSASCSTCMTAPASLNCGYCIGGDNSTSCKSSVIGSCTYPATWTYPLNANVCPNPNDGCTAYSGSCYQCSTAPTSLNCGWCRTSSSTGSCRNGTSSNPTTGTCSYSWAFKPTTNTCPYVSDICTSYSTCSLCSIIASSYGCGWCAASQTCAAGNTNGPTNQGCSSGWTYQPQSSQCSTTTDACNSYSGSCSSCSSAPSTLGCGWCSSGNSANACRSGTSFGPSTTSCSASWYYRPGYYSTCPATGNSCYAAVDCSTCSYLSGCGVCVDPTTGGGSCTYGSSFGPTSGSCPTGSTWMAGTSTGSQAYKCSASVTPTNSCSNKYDCGSCNLTPGCGWCTSGSSSIYSGTCMAGTSNGPTLPLSCPASSFGSPNWYYQTCRNTATSSTCASITDCSTCTATQYCGYCPSNAALGAATCTDGYSGQAFNSNKCPFTDFTTSFSACYTPVTPVNPGAASDGGGAAGIINGNFVPTTIGGIYPAKAKAAFPLLFFVFGCAVIGWCVFGCIPALTPIPGCASVNGTSPNPSISIVLMVFQFISFALMLSAAAADMWDYTTQDTGFFGTAKLYFGVIGMRVELLGTTTRGSYACTVSAGTMTDDDKKLCISFLLGSILVLIYEALALLFSLLALIYAIQYKRSGFLNNRVFSNSGVMFSCSFACVMGWALTTHLILTSMAEESNSLAGSTVTPLPAFGPSWALAFTVTVLQFVITLGWRYLIRATPAANIVGVGAVLSPVMFSGNAPQPAVMQQPAGVYSEYPVTSNPVASPQFATYAQPVQPYAQQPYAAQPYAAQPYAAQPYAQQPVYAGQPAQPTYDPNAQPAYNQGYPQQPPVPEQPAVPPQPAVPGGGYVQQGETNATGFSQI